MGTSSNGKQQNQSYKGIKYIYQDKRGEKFPRICKFLSAIYQESQSYSKTPQ